MSDLNQILSEILNLKEDPEEILIQRDRTESTDTDDSDYEDIDDDDDDDDDELLNEQSISTKDLIKSITIDDENEEINLRPRRLRKHRKDDDEENQHVPDSSVTPKTTRVFADDNDKHNPAYVPRRGKFFEHDDRTSNDEKSLKQESTRQQKHSSDGKWQHDLYFQDQNAMKWKNSSSRGSTYPNFRSHYSRSSMSKGNSSEFERKRTTDRRNFDVFHIDQNTKDSNSSSNKKFFNQQFNRQKVHDDSKYWNKQPRMDRSIFNRTDQYNHRDQRRNNPEKNFGSLRNKVSNEFNVTNNQRYSFQKDHFENKNPNSLSTDTKPNFDQTKRYSHMRHNIVNSSSTLNQFSKDRSTNNISNQNDWSSIPSTSASFVSEQKSIPIEAYRQQPSEQTARQYSRYFPIISSQGPTNQRFSDNQ